MYLHKQFISEKNKSEQHLVAHTSINAGFRKEETVKKLIQLYFVSLLIDELMNHTY